MDERIRALIFQAIDETISSEDFERLQDAIEKDVEVRTEYLDAVNLCESLAEIASDEKSVAAGATSSRGSADASAHEPGVWPSRSRQWNLFSPRLVAVAATVLMLVGGTAFWLGRRGISDRDTRVATVAPDEPGSTESLIAGHATLRRSVDLKWAARSSSYREGDVLPNGLLRIDGGLAEIDFFCGATLIVEGPATLDVESDWSVRVVEGRLRANVPPAARGFVVKAADSEIIDLGTEFALEVSPDVARVEVIDGEVKLRGGDHDGNHLVTGQKRWLKGIENESDTMEGLSSVNDVQRRRASAEADRFAEWKRYAQQLGTDPRLIAYYPISANQSARVVGNASMSGSDRDGILVGAVDRTTGRFGAASAGLAFDRPGARVRTRIDGDFQAFTFACWARIDSLAHRYNALFMGDGYENGEPHWQIRDDGRLMFSVMIDDTENVLRFDETSQRMVTTAGRHRVYFTEPFWDISKSGQWFHLAAVYDPAARRVVQYVNGKQVSSEQIDEDFFIAKLRIGPAEIGNWGQPFRNTPWFAVRNLDGTIDELAIFDSALAAGEIGSLYEQGKPRGY